MLSTLMAAFGRHRLRTVAIRLAGYAELRASDEVVRRGQHKNGELFIEFCKVLNP